jgi:thymidylate synthase
LTTARYAEAASVSDGWLAACRILLDIRGHEATHLVIRMTDPLPEVAEVRSAADRFMASAGHAAIDEVRNTIFPAAMAERFADPDELAVEYLEDYELRSSLAGGQGTYFGRICEYPQPSGPPTPQLAVVTRRLREAREGTRWRAVYPVNIYAAHKDQDKKRNYFPCLSHLEFELACGPGSGAKPDRLDCIALYRNQDITVKGYGNYLGLAQLQAYLARATGFLPGELTVIAGHAMMALKTGDAARLETLLAGRRDVGTA